MKENLLLLFLGLVLQLSMYGQEVPQEQKVVITKIGATWCPNCGLTAWNNFDVLNDEFADKAVILSIHPSSSSQLHSPESRDFSNNLPGAFGQPLFYVHRTKHSTSAIIANTGTAVAEAENMNPVANAGITATINDNMLEVDAKVKFFQEGTGIYFLSLLIVEDGVVGYQSQRGDDAVHKKLLRSSLMGGTFGQEIVNGTVAADSEFSFSDSKIIDPSWNPENLEVAAIIWKRVDGDYEFLNANSVDASLSTSINFLEASGVDISIAPTIIKEQSTISIKTPLLLRNANLSIFNAAGQHITSIYNGAINEGEQNFIIEKSSFNSSGIYFLQLESEGNVITQKLIIE